MLVVQLRKHFPARWPEWFMSATVFAWGFYVVLHPSLFTQPDTVHMMSELAAVASPHNPASFWGLIGVVLGLVRATALFVNGAYTRTPMIRLVMSFASAFLWTQVFLGLFKSDTPNMGLVIYPALVIMDIVSAYRASTDMVFAEKARRDFLRGSCRGRSEYST